MFALRVSAFGFVAPIRFLTPLPRPWPLVFALALAFGLPFVIYVSLGGVRGRVFSSCKSRCRFLFFLVRLLRKFLMVEIIVGSSRSGAVVFESLFVRRRCPKFAFLFLPRLLSAGVSASTVPVKLRATCSLRRRRSHGTRQSPSASRRGVWDACLHASSVTMTYTRTCMSSFLLCRRPSGA